MLDRNTLMLDTLMLKSERKYFYTNYYKIKTGELDKDILMAYSVKLYYFVKYFIFTRRILEHDYLHCQHICCCTVTEISHEKTSIFE